MALGNLEKLVVLSILSFKNCSSAVLLFCRVLYHYLILTWFGVESWTDAFTMLPKSIYRAFSLDQSFYKIDSLFNSYRESRALDWCRKLNRCFIMLPKSLVQSFCKIHSLTDSKCESWINPKQIPKPWLIKYNYRKSPTYAVSLPGMPLLRFLLMFVVDF